MAYSADDFEKAASLSLVDKARIEGLAGAVSRDDIERAALRIASLVMREGVIEGAMMEAGGFSMSEKEAAFFATAIRNRLTGETG